MAFSFTQNGDTVKLVFDPENYATEQSVDIATGTELLVQIDHKSKYPVWVSETQGAGRAGVPCFPGLPVAVANPDNDLYVFSGDGQTVVYITPGATS